MAIKRGFSKGVKWLIHDRFLYNFFSSAGHMTRFGYRSYDEAASGGGVPGKAEPAAAFSALAWPGTENWGRNWAKFAPNAAGSWPCWKPYKKETKINWKCGPHYNYFYFFIKSYATQYCSVLSKWRVFHQNELPCLPPSSLELWRRERAKAALILIGHYGNVFHSHSLWLIGVRLVPRKSGELSEMIEVEELSKWARRQGTDLGELCRGSDGSRRPGCPRAGASPGCR